MHQAASYRCVTAKHGPRRTGRRHQMIVVAAWAVGLALCACATPPGLPSPQHRISLTADGQERTVASDATTVRALLEEYNIELGDLDRVEPPEVTALRDQMTVRVTRVEHQTYTITQTVPFERQTVRDIAVPTGENRLLQAGQPGLIERHYRITYEDHVESERVLLNEMLVQSPQAEVRLIGARPRPENVTITGTLAYLANQDAWVVRESSFQRRRLTSLGDLDGRVFSLSPDSQLLLFTRAVTESEHLNELWLVKTTEATPNPVPLNVTDILWADWHPQGQQGRRPVAWSTAEVTEQAPGWRGSNDLWIATITDRNTLTARQQVLEPESGGGYGWWGTRYAWSPDGSALAYSRPDSVGLVNPQSTTVVPLLAFVPLRTFSSWSWNPAVAWAPDGELICTVIHADDSAAETSEESPVFNLTTVSSAGTVSGTLATEAGMWATPRFSPDGGRLLYGRATIPYQSATSTYELVIIDRDGSNKATVYVPQPYSGLDLPEWVWSPDGDQIGFIELGDISVLDLGSGVVRTLTNDGGATALRWQ